ncbi:hypothetical protein ACIQTU_14500 [Brevundimonas sp. NPDC090276]|uniref:hypothetical protein n=1 Tax=Brevundimonas sp. NPDC090276 TaxID=3363956 RepID=UPI00383BF33F
MSSSAAPSSLSRILWGSLIGAAIGLVLLALGVAILWNAADQRLAETQAATPSAETATPVESTRKAAETSPVPYPLVGPGAATPPASITPEPAMPTAATSIWRSIFDTEEEKADIVAPIATAGPRAPPPAAAPRPAPRPATPRRPPEPQRQDESLFF